MGIPDYANAKTLVSAATTSSYEGTAPSDGYLIVGARSTNAASARCQIVVNGSVEIGQLYVDYTQFQYAQATDMYPLPSGTKYKINPLSGQLRSVVFVPVK